MQDGAILKQILARLDVLICLELQKRVPEQYVRVATRIDRLVELGLSPAEVASIVGKSTNYVTATISRKKNLKESGKNE